MPSRSIIIIATLMLLVIAGLTVLFQADRFDLVTARHQPTLTPTIVPATLPGDEEVLHTQPIPTTIAFAPQTGEVAGASTSQVAEVKTSVNHISQAIQTQNSAQLHGLLSSELAATFSAEAVAQALSSLTGQTGLALVGEPQISGEWAKQQVHYTNDNQTNDYWVILRHEDAAWKLFGTALVE